MSSATRGGTINIYIMYMADMFAIGFVALQHISHKF